MQTYEEISRFWTTRSDNYSNCVNEELSTGRPDDWLACIESQTDCNQPLRVLDAGCGPGFFSIIMSKAGHEVIGIDGSDGMLNHARENAMRQGASPIFEKMDCCHTEFENDIFDLIISRNVTHTFQDHRSAYEEWRRILKPGGILLIFDANWHLPYVQGEIRREAIYNEAECFRLYGLNFSGGDCPYEYIGSNLYPENYRVLGDLVRPDFDVGVLTGLGYKNISFERDVTDKLWSEKEKLMYHATPLFMIRAIK